MKTLNAWQATRDARDVLASIDPQAEHAPYRVGGSSNQSEYGIRTVIYCDTPEVREVIWAALWADAYVGPSITAMSRADRDDSRAKYCAIIFYRASVPGAPS